MTLPDRTEAEYGSNNSNSGANNQTLSSGGRSTGANTNLRAMMPGLPPFVATDQGIIIEVHGESIFCPIMHIGGGGIVINLLGIEPPQRTDTAYTPIRDNYDNVTLSGRDAIFTDEE